MNDPTYIVAEESPVFFTQCTVRKTIEIFKVNSFCTNNWFLSAREEKSE